MALQEEIQDFKDQNCFQQAGQQLTLTQLLTHRQLRPPVPLRGRTLTKEILQHSARDRENMDSYKALTNTEFS